MRFAALLLLVPCLAGWNPATQKGGGTPDAGGGSGQSYSDSFTRANNTDLNANCAGGDTCEWVEVGTADVSINANELDSATGAWRAHTNSNAAADTADQYVGARLTSAVWGVVSSIVLRDEGLETGGCFYALLFDVQDNYQIRACDEIGEGNCDTLATITPSNLGDGTNMFEGDALGLAVDDQTGNSVTFSVWKWENQAPPARGSWGTADWTVCSSGCDQGFATNPTAAGSGACDAGRRGGFYDEANNPSEWDDWMFGDNP